MTEVTVNGAAAADVGFCSKHLSIFTDLCLEADQNLYFARSYMIQNMFCTTYSGQFQRIPTVIPVCHAPPQYRTPRSSVSSGSLQFYYTHVILPVILTLTVMCFLLLIVFLYVSVGLLLFTARSYAMAVYATTADI